MVHGPYNCPCSFARHQHRNGHHKYHRWSIHFFSVNADEFPANAGFGHRPLLRPDPCPPLLPCCPKTLRSTKTAEDPVGSLERVCCIQHLLSDLCYVSWNSRRCIRCCCPRNASCLSLVYIPYVYVEPCHYLGRFRSRGWSLYDLAVSKI